MAQALAIKYRPKTFDDVTEQGSVKVILQQQLKTGEWKHAYLFCGSAGTGKTTCARIFANELNKGQGNPVELDAASNNGVDDVREIISQSKTKSLDSDYKVFIIDECHALSGSAWQAMLKIIEEPPATSVFIFCTTDPQKIPKTIISRVQRYDFKRISQQGIVDRLYWILDSEGYNDIDKGVDKEPLEYIAKLADGGMRDAITLVDKCVSYSTELTLQNVVAALGTVDYEVMIRITDALLSGNTTQAITELETIYREGKDIKQFLKLYIKFIIDVNKYIMGCNWTYITLPRLDSNEEWLQGIQKKISAGHVEREELPEILGSLITLDSSIKYSATPLYDIEAAFITW